jgi:ABC-type dipeptide/oligopeptide/nickel transport system permease subunit
MLQRLGRAVRDRSFIIGSVLVTIFLLVAVLGPEVAPHNPYLRDRVQIIDGEVQRAPFPPSDLYPMGTDDQGRDMLSMLLYGARQTLMVAFVAMVIRLLLGLLLGTLAGWWPNSTFDRAVTVLTEFMAAVPGLILAMLLVFAVGIRRGQIAFIVALSLVGWGEVAQIVRSSVMVIRNKLFILASRALGLSPAQTLSRHVLPNLLSTLLALAALEMGGVLLLLGELGFVNVFVGGGGVYADDAIGVVHYFDVPDWGAMLGTSWRYFRSLPWLPMAPALAFFVAILGFNLFGYGLQRFIEKGRFHPSGWSVFRFFVVIGLLLFGARALLASTGIEAQFTDLAREFDVQRAWGDVAYLTRPELEGRPPGPGGGFEAAGYVAYQFEQAGLTTLTNGGYYQSFAAARAQVTAEPVLEILGADGEPVARFEAEVSFDPTRYFQAGDGNCGPTCREHELAVVGTTPESVADFGGNAGLRPSRMLLLLDPGTELYVPYQYSVPRYAAALHVMPDDQIDPDDVPPAFEGTFFMDEFPHLYVGESAARQLLAQAGLDLDELYDRMDAGELIDIDTDLRVRVEAGVVYEEMPGANVIGYFPGADNTTAGDRLLVAADYTGVACTDGDFCPGANDNASGVAVLMEVARLWHELGFEPKRTVVFAAFDQGGAKHFVNHSPFPVSPSDRWTTVVLRGVGAGGARLSRAEEGMGLARAFDQSARRFGVRTTDLDPQEFFFHSVFHVDATYSGLMVRREGDGLSGTPDDTLERLDPRLFAETGRTLAHYLMVLSAQ